jgi:hypothetical protein
MLQLSLSLSIIGSAKARDSFNARNSFTWATEQVKIMSSGTKLTTNGGSSYLPELLTAKRILEFEGERSETYEFPHAEEHSIILSLRIP